MERSGLFLSYNTEFINRAAQFAHCLRRRVSDAVYFHPEERRAGEFDKRIETALNQLEYFVLLVGSGTEGSDWQKREALHWEARSGEDGRSKVVVVLLDGSRLPTWVPEKWDKVEQIRGDTGASHWVVDATTRLLQMLRMQESSFDDLPVEPIARYEKKDIIAAYVNGTIAPEHAALVAKGYPESWPPAARASKSESLGWIKNPLQASKYGTHRKEGAAVRVDARVNVGASSDADAVLTFPEAGPRETIIRPNLQVAVLVSGGIAPGINAVLAGIVERHVAYARHAPSDSDERGLQVWGYREGFRPLCEGITDRTELSLEDLQPHVNSGGSLLPTAREDTFLTDNPSERARLLENVVEQLHAHKIDILYVLGGQGSMRAAHAIWAAYRQKHTDSRLAVIGVPKTMDNDILWVWQSFGFLSAVEKAREHLIQLHTEVTSNPRLGVMQLFGSGSGYVVSHAAMGSNVCDLALIPEMDFKMEDVCAYMAKRLKERKKKKGTPWGLVVMAETAIPRDVAKYVRDAKESDGGTYKLGLTQDEIGALEKFESEGRRVIGQTPDYLRSAGLKIVAGVLEYHIRNEMGKKSLRSNGSSPPPVYWNNFRVVTNEPRHIIRSMAPSVTDVALGIRLGTMAVDMAMAGYTDCMVSQWLTEYVVVPLKLVVLGRKEVPTSGIFWKTVTSKTGQMDQPGLAMLHEE